MRGVCSFSQASPFSGQVPLQDHSSSECGLQLSEGFLPNIKIQVKIPNVLVKKGSENKFNDAVECFLGTVYLQRLDHIPH